MTGLFRLYCLFILIRSGGPILSIDLRVICPINSLLSTPFGGPQVRRVLTVSHGRVKAICVSPPTSLVKQIVSFPQSYTVSCHCCFTSLAISTMVAVLARKWACNTVHRYPRNLSARFRLISGCIPTGLSFWTGTTTIPLSCSPVLFSQKLCSLGVLQHGLS